MFKWRPPIYPNGPILFYSLHWTKGDETYSANVSADSSLTYKFPNTTSMDTFNMSIRAVSSAGPSEPYIKEINPFDYYMTPDHQILGILIGVFVSLLAILICIWMFLRKKHCSKHQHDNDASNTPLPPGQNQLNCTAELHEMQTLINRPDDTSIATIVPNGNLNHLDHGFIKQRPDVTNVNETRSLTNNEKPLKASPKLSINRHEIEPLTKDDSSLSSSSVPTITELTTFHPKPNGRVSTSSGKIAEMSQNCYVKPPPPVALDDAKYRLEPITLNVSSQLHHPHPHHQHIPYNNSYKNKSNTSNSSIYSSSSSNSSSSGSTVVVPVVNNAKNSQVN